MSLGRCWILAVLLLVSAAPNGFSAEPDELTFRDALQRLTDARSQIKTYELNVIGVVDYKLQEVKLTDGSTYVVERKPVSFILQLVFDRNADRLLVAREDSFVVVKSGERVTEDWKVFASTPQWDLVRENGAGVVLSHDSKNRSGRPEYFDPLAFGLLLGEFRTGATLAALHANLLVYADKFQMIDADGGKLHYRLADHGRVINIDSQRDYWPVSMEFSEHGIKSTLTVESVHDHWLPVTGTMELPDQRIDLKFNWLAVNKPVDPRFAEQDISQRYRFKIVDQRQ